MNSMNINTNDVEMIPYICCVLNSPIVVIKNCQIIVAKIKKMPMTENILPLSKSKDAFFLNLSL